MEQVFEVKGESYDALVWANSNSFVVLAGSIIKPTTVPSYEAKYKEGYAQRSEICKQNKALNCNIQIVRADLPFSSKSSAISFVRGYISSIANPKQLSTHELHQWKQRFNPNKLAVPISAQKVEAPTSLKNLGTPTTQLNLHDIRITFSNEFAPKYNGCETNWQKVLSNKLQEQPFRFVTCEPFTLDQKFIVEHKGFKVIKVENCYGIACTKEQLPYIMRNMFETNSIYCVVSNSPIGPFVQACRKYFVEYDDDTPLSIENFSSLQAIHAWACINYFSGIRLVKFPYKFLGPENEYCIKHKFETGVFTHLYDKNKGLVLPLAKYRVPLNQVDIAKPSVSMDPLLITKHIVSFQRAELIILNYNMQVPPYPQALEQQSDEFEEPVRSTARNRSAPTEIVQCVKHRNQQPWVLQPSVVTTDSSVNHTLYRLNYEEAEEKDYIPHSKANRVKK